jgi:hypothetical protein
MNEAIKMTPEAKKKTKTLTAHLIEMNFIGDEGIF